MQVYQTESVLFVLGFTFAAVSFIGIVFGLNVLLSPRNPTPEKDAPYECGLEQAGAPLSAQRVRFSTIAMLSVLFGADAILLFAVAGQLRGSFIAFAEIFTFVALLALGLGYAWRKGGLEWR